jgi:hypothetical protein
LGGVISGNREQLGRMGLWIMETKSNAGIKWADESATTSYYVDWAKLVQCIRLGFYLYLINTTPVLHITVGSKTPSLPDFEPIMAYQQ